MRRIILIEDRPERMNLFLSSIENYSIADYPLLDLKTNQGFDEVVEVMSTESFSEYFKNYDAIICHRSAFQEDKRSLLKNYCKKENKTLVFFSGGITESIYQNIGYCFLSINSKDLYTENFFLFLEKARSGLIEPLILQYGAGWEINVLLTLRDKLNQLNLFVNKNTDTFYEMFDITNFLVNSYFSKELSTLNEDFSLEDLRMAKNVVEEKIKTMFAFDL